MFLPLFLFFFDEDDKRGLNESEREERVKPLRYSKADRGEIQTSTP